MKKAPLVVLAMLGAFFISPGISLANITQPDNSISSDTTTAGSVSSGSIGWFQGIGSGYSQTVNFMSSYFGGGNPDLFNTKIQEYSDSGYTILTNQCSIIFSQSDIGYNGATNWYEFPMDGSKGSVSVGPCPLTMVPSKYYKVAIQQQNSGTDGGFKIYGSNTLPLNWGTVSNPYGAPNNLNFVAGTLNITSTSSTPGLIWFGGINPTTIFTSSTTVNINDAFNSGGLSTTSIKSFCDTNLPYDSSSIIQATITALPNGLCRAVAFLTIPNTNSLNQIDTVQNNLKTRFPFSYVTSITGTWSTLQASTTMNSPVLAFNLHDLGIGSTSPIGNILPNFNGFSTTTVKQYFPVGLFDILKGLAAIALVLTLIADIFFSAKHMMVKK